MKHLAFVLCFIFLLSPLARASEQKPEDAASISAEMKAAINKVVGIINQPVIHVARNGNMTGVGVFSPGWFHPGAIKPDFNHVDVRQSRELPYEKFVYVTSDVTPTEMFIGRDLEFNAMTKYFYVDRNLPKKKLTDAEMIEINRLYRIIGADEDKLAALRGEKPAAEASSGAGGSSVSMSFIRNMLIIGVLAVGAVVFLGSKKKA